MEEKKIDQQVAPQVVEDVQDIDSKIAFGTNSLVDKAMDESAVMTERKIEQDKKINEKCPNIRKLNNTLLNNTGVK